MDQLQGGFVDDGRLPDLELLQRSSGPQVTDDGPETIGALWMSSARVVSEKRLGVSEACGYDVLEAAPGDRRGTGCNVGRSRGASGCTGCSGSAGVPPSRGGSPRNTRSRLSPSRVSY